MNFEDMLLGARQFKELYTITAFLDDHEQSESALPWIIRELRLHGVQKEIIDLSLKLDGRPFAGENTVIFSKYSVLYNIFPDSFIVFCNNCVALKKEKHRNNLNHQ